MMDTHNSGQLRIGIIGAGFIAQVAHLHSYAQEPRARLVAISDPRPKLLADVSGAFGIPQARRHHGDIVGDPGIDAILVCVHRRCLAPLVAQALKAGKSVFSEKPMAYSLTQASSLVAARMPDRIYAVGYMKRFDPGVRLFRDLPARERMERDLGDIVHVEVADFCPTYGVAIPPHARTDEPETYRYEEWARGPEGMPATYLDDFEYTLNVASHDMNLARWLLAPDLSAQSLFVHAGRAQTAVLSAGSYDVLMRIGRSDSGSWDQSLKVYFSKGRMELRLPSPLARQETATIGIVRPGRSEIVSVPPVGKVWAFRAQAAHFTAAALGEVSLETPGDDGLNDMALIEDLWAKVIWRQ
jgi:predicted dehydrogenase